MEPPVMFSCPRDCEHFSRDECLESAWMRLNDLTNELVVQAQRIEALTLRVEALEEREVGLSETVEKLTPRKYVTKSNNSALGNKGVRG